MSMTEAEALSLVGGYAVAYDGQGQEHGRGRVFAYSMVPTFSIEREDGSRFSWRYDMCEPDDLANTQTGRRD